MAGVNFQFILLVSSRFEIQNLLENLLLFSDQIEVLGIVKFQ